MGTNCINQIIIMKIVFTIALISISAAAISQDPFGGRFNEDASESIDFITQALEKLPISKDGFKPIDKMEQRFRDIYEEYKRLLKPEENFSVYNRIIIKENTVQLRKGVEMNKADYLYMVQQIFEYSQATQTLVKISFLTDSTGATIRYQTPYDRVAQIPPKIANNLTNLAAANMEICQYYIWCERNGKKTSDVNLYDILADQAITIQERIKKKK